MNKWSKQKIMQDIKILGNENFSKLTQTNMKKYNYNLFKSSLYYFGSWKAAIQCSGFDYDIIKKSRNEWNKDKIIYNIKNMDRKYLSCPTKYNASLYTAANRYFGSWKSAISAADIPVTKKQLIDAIKLLYAEDKKSLSYSKIKLRDKYLYNLAIKYFKKWSKAIEAAGFNYYDIKEKKTWNKNNIIIKIKEMPECNLNTTYILKNFPELYSSAKYHFSSWRSAVIAAGFDYDKISISTKWSKELIIDNIQKLAEEDIGKLTSYNLYKDNAVLLVAACNYFGSLDAAVNSAGINYDQIKYKFGKEHKLYSILCELISYKIIRQKTFKWLKYQKSLYIDFYIPGLNLAIEYNGAQHYGPVDFAGKGMKWATDKFIISKIRDNIKYKLLSENNINLLIIPYTEMVDKENIKSILIMNDIKLAKNISIF